MSITYKPLQHVFVLPLTGCPGCASFCTNTSARQRRGPSGVEPVYPTVMSVRSTPRSRSHRAAQRAVGTAAELRNLFSELPEACDNTLLIAERIESYDEVFDHVDEMP